MLLLGSLLKSSSAPQPPQPVLAIHLYQPADKVYKPDDIVAGHIDLTPVVPITPIAIEASLWGHSRIWYRVSSSNQSDGSSYSHYRDNAPLFNITANVLSDRHGEKQTALQPGKTYTFPFSFRFPAATENTRFGQYKEVNDERWIASPHPLPPTFLSNTKYASENQPNFSKIEYGVGAKLICPGVGVVQGKTLVDLDTSAPVLFQPVNPHVQEMMNGPLSVIRYPKTFTVQSSALKSQGPSKIGFRQGMRDRFSSSTPKVDFEAAVEMPDLLASGCEFSFRASFTTMSKSDGVSQVPAITFTVLKLELLDFTFSRAAYDREASSLMDGHHIKNIYEFWPPPQRLFDDREMTPYNERKNPLNALPESITLELGQAPPGYSEKNLGASEKNSGGEMASTGQVNSGEVWFTSRIPGITPPSFKSFAISRVYRVKVKLGVEIGGKQFVLETESHVRSMGSAPA